MAATGYAMLPTGTLKNLRDTGNIVHLSVILNTDEVASAVLTIVSGVGLLLSDGGHVVTEAVVVAPTSWAR